MSVHQFKPKAGDTSEKITINLGVIDLGQIDLLVQEGFYSNRTDLIRTAIRNQLSTHAEVVRETVARKTFVLGLQHYSRGDLEAVQAAVPTGDSKLAGQRECQWQRDQLPDAIRELVLDDQRRRNAICWSVFDG